MNFTIEQIQLMNLYRTDAREQLLQDMQDALPYTTEDIAEAYMRDCIEALETMTDDDFKTINFNMTF